MQDQGGQELQPAPKPSKRKSVVYLSIVVAVAVVAGVGIWWMADMTIRQNVQVSESPQPVIPTKPTAVPQVTTDVVLDGRSHVWEIAFLPDGTMLFTERGGKLSAFKDGKTSQVLAIDDVYVRGEGGLLGLAVDPQFAENRYVYTCFNSTKGGPDVRVVRWKLRAELSGADERQDIITRIPSNSSGRHSGCRLGFGPDGYLWAGTGDAAVASNPLAPGSLGGKILRVDRDGKVVPGNMLGDIDPRVYSFGHRNTQGLAFFPQERDGVAGVSVEHGSSVDDEVNLLVPGNFGWDPDPLYTEIGVPMTDKQKLPDAIDAIWSSGSPTQAPSGATFLSSNKWKAWEGALAVVFLKDQKVTIMQFDDNFKLTKEEVLFKNQFGRIRAAALGPDGNLYIGTSSGTNDKIIRVTPH